MLRIIKIILPVILVAVIVPRALVYEQKNNLRTELDTLKVTVDELESNTVAAIQEIHTTQPIFKTWDGIVELSDQFSRTLIKPIASPNQSFDKRVWWGEITGNAGEVLSLMYYLEKYDHTQLYSFAYANPDQATALFYVIETIGVINDDN